MIRKQLFIAMGAVLAFAVGAQEAPPAPSVEQKPAEQTAPPPADKQTAAPKNTPKSTAKDRMELDSTSITGNRELPKVLYIVPWKKSGMGDLPGRPSNSLLDEVLAPVDRDVFRRQTGYFSALDAHVNAEPKPAPPASASPSTK